MKITEQFMLFQKAYFQFYQIEAGCAYQFDLSPFGTNKPLLFRIAEILNMPEPKNQDDLLAIANIYLDFGFNINGLLNHIDIAPDEYVVPNVSKAYYTIYKKYGKKPKEFEINMEAAINNNFEDYKTTVHVTDTHIAMIKHGLWKFQYQQQVLHGNNQFVKVILGKELLLLHEIHIKNKNINSYPIVSFDENELTLFYHNSEIAGTSDIKTDIIKNDKSLTIKKQKYTDQIQSELALVLNAMALYGKLK